MKAEADRSLVLVVMFLLGLGLVQVYSSSFIFAIESFNDGLLFVKKQGLFVLLAFAVLLITAHLPWRIVVRVSQTLWCLSIIGVALTLIPGFGVKVGGASRWLNLGAGIRMEPSELLKYTYPIALATATSIRFESHNIFKNLGLAGLIGLPMLLLLKQPDFGSVAILSVVIFTLFFVRGLKWRYVFAALSTMACVFYLLIIKVDYRMARVTAFLDPWSDPAQKGFQVIQSMLGFYSGGFSGVGLGQGQGKLFFLPEAHTDFTLSVLGEELGFIGILLTMGLLAYITLKGMQIAARAESEFKQMVALGITLVFTVTSIVNAGVAMGILPTKGLGMPFLSYGGSALLSTCFGLGILLNIDRTQSISKVKSFIKINDR